MTWSGGRRAVCILFAAACAMVSCAPASAGTTTKDLHAPACSLGGTGAARPHEHTFGTGPRGCWRPGHPCVACARPSAAGLGPTGEFFYVTDARDGTLTVISTG